MLELLKVVASSYPIAIMFIALCVAAVAFYIVNCINRSDAADKAIRVAQSRDVTPIRRADY